MTKKIHFRLVQAVWIALAVAGYGCDTGDGNLGIDDGNTREPYSDSGAGDEQDDDGDSGRPVVIEEDAGSAGMGGMGGAGGSAGMGGMGGNSGSSGAAGNGEGGGTVSSFGFDVRIPQWHTVQCQDPANFTHVLDEMELDWVCTFDYEGVSGHVYVQSKPVGCTVLMGPMPDFETQAAYLSVDGEVSSLQNVVYEWGGNHANDSLSFDYQDRRLKYYHSSFGFGWRTCQPMDCMQVFASAQEEEPAEDGCTMERTIPVVCSQILEDGSFDELVDNFAPCPGDANYE